MPTTLPDQLGPNESTSPSGDLERVLQITVRESLQTEGLQRLEVATVKEGPRTYKTVTMMHFGASPSSISKRELCFQSWDYRKGTFTEKPEARFRCENEEIGLVQSFLEAQLGGPGKYKVVPGGSPITQALADVSATRRLNETELSQIVNFLTDQPDLVSILSSTGAATQMRAAAEVARSREAVVELTRLVDDPNTDERAFQGLLETNWWLFGGQYVDRVERRRFTGREEVDLVLVRTDGVIHVVELKRANVLDLVQPHRSHFTVGASVNEAVNQVAHYLRVIDEQSPILHSEFSEFGVSFRRARATVVIGHPQFVEVEAEKVREAIRIYNSHLGRIEVITYEDLLRSGESWLKRLEAELTGVVLPGEPGPQGDSALATPESIDPFGESPRTYHS